MAVCVVLVVVLLGCRERQLRPFMPTIPADVDAEFLAALSSQGITYASHEVMIAAGHVELDRGETPARVAHDVMENKDVLPGSNLDSFAHTARSMPGASNGPTLALHCCFDSCAQHRA